MAEVRLVGRADRMERDLYLSVAHELRSWAPDLSHLRPFVAFCALDAEREDDETLDALATRLVGSGCHYVSAWGPGCERVHDSVDLVWIRENPESAALPPDAWDETYVMTTWHDEDPLDEALEFAVFAAYIEEHDLANLLAIVSPQYAEQVEHGLLNINS